MGNTWSFSNSQVEEAIALLRTSLPSAWELELARETELMGAVRKVDALLVLTAPDRTRATLLLEEKRSLSPRRARELGFTLNALAKEIAADGVLVVAPFLGIQTCERLRSAGIAYIDLTGNAWLGLAKPALYIQVQGAKKDPDPRPQPVRSLKGAVSARIVRALCDWRPPIGTRELALRARTSAGYTSRVLQFLEGEDLIERTKRGQVVDVNWVELLRRWAQYYDVTRTNVANSFLAPRGIQSFLETARGYDGRMALTGMLAAPAPAAIAGTRLAMCYVDDIESATTALSLRRAEGGSNVLLLQPFDKVVYERMRSDDGIKRVAYSQCVVDLMTGPGRDPSVAEAVLAWMRENEEEWRD